MKPRVLATFLALLAACVAQAHFTFVVPQQGGASAKVFLSENIIPDGSVDVGLIADTKLWVRDAHGDEAPLSLSRDGGVLTTPLPGSGARVIRGLTDLGVMNRGKAHLLLYYPKTIVGDAFDPKMRVGEDAVVELVPVGRSGDFKLLLLGRGKPVADAEITVMQPDGSEEVFTTDAGGHTQSFNQKGRHSAWARFWEDTPGERDGQKYEQVRHYATLVFDTDPGDGEVSSAAAITAKQVAPLPEATSSFGSAVADGWLYVYGGHIAPTHVYSTEAVSGRFHRKRLDGQGGWEELPSGPGLQGMNLAAHDGMIYRIGGMAPQNAPDEPADNRSVAENARFNPKKMKWEELPPLPEPRSSHDVVVLGDQLLVVGGWTMKGNGEDWPETVLTLDLSKKKPRWNSIPAPFRRRALMAAAFDGKMYVVGGFTDEHQVQRAVSIYDPKTQSWSDGPELPEGDRTAGFAPAAGVHEGNLYVSVSDGTLWRLAESGDAWEKAGASTPRLAHRLASDGRQVLILGGAAKGANLDLVEAIETGL